MFTFTSAARLVSQLLAARQARASVPRRDRISALIVADSGTVAQKGSAKRVMARLTFLALTGVAAVRGFPDRTGLGA
jgi:hypothetical protein